MIPPQENRQVPGSAELPAPEEPSWVRDAVTRAYFETEWQQVPRTQGAMFEHLCLLIFQNGLWWSLVLKKRAVLREHFKDFDPLLVAELGDRQVARMLADPRMIRNEAKIRCCIANARLLLEHDLSLPLLFESALPAPVLAESVATLPHRLEATDLLAGELKELGLGRAGQVVCCALAQATGFIQLVRRAPPS